MNFLVFGSLLVVSCAAAPHGFNLAHMQKLASGAKSVRSSLAMDDGLKTLGELDSLHVVGLTTHPTDANKLIYADETALYEFDKRSGKSTMVAGGESKGLSSHRKPVDGEGAEAEFKYITKILARESGIYVFDYDTLRLFTPADASVRTLMSLFDEDWMERSPVTGTVTNAEDRVYFTTTEGFGHFVLSVSLPDGDMSLAELVTAGPSMISSMELSKDEKYLMLGDIDAKTLIRVTIGQPNSEEFIDMGREPFYPGGISALNEGEILVVNSMAKTLEVFDVSSLTKSEAICHDDDCPSNPLDVAVDEEDHVVYVLDMTSDPNTETYKFAIKAIGEGKTTDVAEQVGSRTEEKDKVAQYIAYMKRMIQLYEDSIECRAC